MNTYQVCTEAHLNFAKISGDYNPLHMDPIIARRLLFGRPVVHGMHTLIWAISQATFGRDVAIENLSAWFKAPVYLDEDVNLEISNRPDGSTNLTAKSNNQIVLTANLEFTETLEINTIYKAGCPPRLSCDEISEEGLDTAAGDVSVHCPQDDIVSMFPRYASTRVLQQVPILLACTRVVGMRCPGTHSVLSRVQLNFDKSDNRPRPNLSYRVSKWNSRLRLLQLNVCSHGCEGTVQSFVRREPASQLSLEETAKRLEKDKYLGRKCLVIGGSRGIGEAAAKMLAAGGAAVELTYSKGQTDANRVSSEINAFGGECRVHHLDVLSDPIELNIADGITHCYMFASPPIRAKSGPFCMSTFQFYCRYYVSAVERICNWLESISVASIEFFYPSTTFISEPQPGFAEYAAAKAAGETLCRQIAAANSQFLFQIPRLPRLRTDQTQGLLESQADEPFIELIKLL